jgi:hypothetical protein
MLNPLLRFIGCCDFSPMQVHTNMKPTSSFSKSLSVFKINFWALTPLLQIPISCDHGIEPSTYLYGSYQELRDFGDLELQIQRFLLQHISIPLNAKLVNSRTILLRSFGASVLYNFKLQRFLLQHNTPSERRSGEPPNGHFSGASLLWCFLALELWASKDLPALHFNSSKPRIGKPPKGSRINSPRSLLR